MVGNWSHPSISHLVMTTFFTMSSTNTNTTQMNDTGSSGVSAQADNRVTEYTEGVEAPPPRDMPQISSVDPVEGDSLGEWFKRPRSLMDITWSVGSELMDVVLDPWELFFSNPQVKSKAKNFRFFRGDLHVKVTITGQPFYHGLVVVSYKPLSIAGSMANLVGSVSCPEVDDFSGGNISFDSYGTSSDQPTKDAVLGLFLQRPHMFLDPSCDEGGEMVLPYVNYCEKSILYDPSVSYSLREPLGKLSFTSVTPLRSSNLSVAPAVITVYAWMDSVELTVPTIEAASGTIEPCVAIIPAIMAARSTKVVSRVFSAIATGTKIVHSVATTIGDIAKALGFTKVPIYTSFALTDGRTGFGMANTTIAPLTEVLALNPESRVSLDPTTVGLPPDDAMTYEHILSHDNFLGTFRVTSAMTIDTPLLRATVTPDFYTIVERVKNSTSVYSAFNTPGSLLAGSHAYWRGPITYNFKVICNKYHKCRMVVSFDPSVTAPTVLPRDKIGTVKTMVIDVCGPSDFKFEVPYTSRTTWCSNLEYYCFSAPGPSRPFDPNLTGNSINFGLNSDSNYNLGILQVHLLSPLMSQAASDTITIMVSADFSQVEFAVPHEPRDSIYNPGTSIETSCYAFLNDVTQACSGLVDYESNIGDPVKSVRNISQRCSYYLNTLCPSNYTIASKTERIVEQVFPTFPIPPIVEQSGSVNAVYGSFLNKGKFSSATFLIPPEMNLVPLTNLVLFNSCYIGWRGGVEYRVDPPANASNSKTLVQRLYSPAAYIPFGNANQSIQACRVSASRPIYNWYTGDSTDSSYVEHGDGGIAVTDIWRYLNFRIPYASADRMASCNPNIRPDSGVFSIVSNTIRFANGYPSATRFLNERLSSFKLTNRQYNMTDAAITPTIPARMYASAGDDYTLFGYLNPPVIHLVPKSALTRDTT